jgi:heme-degrading monooxygenase HmoA
MGYRKEADMAIGVLIKHVTKNGVSAKVLLPHIIELRALAVRQPGYISGETFFHLERPEECLVISRWTSLEHWQKWIKEPRRNELHEIIQKHLETKIEYNIYGVGLW